MITCGSLSMTPATPRGPWGCSRSPGTYNTQRSPALPRDARGYDPGKNLVLRQRRRAGQRREPRNADARRDATGDGRQAREGKTRREQACLHVRHRPGDPETLMDYWVPGVAVMGVHELLANALVMRGEKESDYGLRGEPSTERTPRCSG